MINQELLAPQLSGLGAGMNRWSFPLELPFLLLLRWEGKTPSNIPSGPGRDSLCTFQTKSCTSSSFNIPLGLYQGIFHGFSRKEASLGLEAWECEDSVRYQPQKNHSHQGIFA